MRLHIEHISVLAMQLAVHYCFRFTTLLTVASIGRSLSKANSSVWRRRRRRIGRGTLISKARYMKDDDLMLV